GGGKGTANDIRHTDDSRTADGNQRHIANSCERLHAAAITATPGGDLRASLIGREGVSNPNGNARLRHGAKRLRMKHLRAKISELGCFEIGNFGNSARFRHEAWVGR